MTDERQTGRTTKLLRRAADAGPETTVVLATHREAESWRLREEFSGLRFAHPNQPEKCYGARGPIYWDHFALESASAAQFVKWLEAHQGRVRW